MTGIYVVVGAGLLGVFSCMLIAWSLWTRSQARKRARERQLASGQYAAIPPAALPAFQQPAFQPPAPPVGHTILAAPPVELEREPRTEFMTSAELFGQVAPPDEPTQFLSAADLFAQAEDEEEVATAFMSTEELFGQRSEETMVLSEDAIIPEPPRPLAPSPAPSPAPRPSSPTAPRRPAPAPRYTGFVGDRAEDRDDDDDDDDLDDGDPETELVHQADLLRLMTPHKRPE